MNILGLGFDATDIPRVRATFDRYGERFLRRIFTEGEIAYCTRRRDPVPSLAARFAAKEAAIKVLRPGDEGVPWREIEVRRDPAGWVALELTGRAAALAVEAGVRELAVSLSHEEGLACAVVIAEIPTSDR